MGLGRGVWGVGREAWGDSKLVGYSGGLIFRILQVVTVVGYGLEIVGYVSYTNDRRVRLQPENPYESNPYKLQKSITWWYERFLLL